ncbi:hypothetical protein [Pseudoflavitalea rhizosphaerae]|uniref:hypothetical protein n=1 Tax=Pseudoflavitalea rhizosphaerae TaxID=1884793 RepID=UPI000F8E7669|nr:hypothetical protein [Pseudoflavitalea rhizosphaerae]
MKQFLTGMAALMVMLTLASCSSTELLSSWKAENANLKQYNKVLVVGLTGNKDRSIRDNVESAMVNSLKANNVNAVAASETYGPKAFEKMSDADVVSKVKSNGYDGIVILTLLDKEKEKYYTPGRVSYTPYFTYYSRYWRSWRTMYNRVYEPGYYSNTTNYVLEANLYNVTEDRLEYSAQTRSFDPGNAATLASGFTKTVVADMVKKGVIPGK